MNSLCRRSVGKILGALGVSATLLLLVPLVPIQAQDDDVEQLEELREERERIAREAALAVVQIDVVTATVEEVSKALDDLEAFVALQQSRLEEAKRSYDTALRSVDIAQNEREAVIEETGLVRAHLTELAVSSFTGESSSMGDDITALILSDDPGESARFIHLLELQTGSLSDLIDHLRSLEARAAELLEAEQSSAAAASESLKEVEARTTALDEALAAQQRVVTGAEIRLESQIAEAAILQERDSELATEIRDQQESINRRITIRANANGVDVPSPVDLRKIVRLDFTKDGLWSFTDLELEDGEEPGSNAVDAEPLFSIEVHEDIAEQTTLLFEAAIADGLDLAGWGYRPIQRQIELRAAHCGGTDYDIWHKPVFECAPPTARPGFSKHEQGRAIDFTHNGTSIKSHADPAFIWLQKNAPQYGFVNLPSEPWHWSIAEGDEQLPVSSAGSSASGVRSEDLQIR